MKLKIKESQMHYLLIVLYGLLVVLITTGFDNVFGSEIDWVGQHSAFPEVFRQNFYQTGRLLPNFMLELGGGQNIFNFAYYGLLSPIFLISYILPFVGMITFTCIMGVVQYILGGVFVYIFLKKHFDKTVSFFAAIIFLSMAPIAVYARYHIMFVWYTPFLILSLMGLDRYFEKKKSAMFIISTVCIVLTNYYFSVGCLICLFIYAIYRLLKDNPFSWKTFLFNVLKTGLLFTVPVLLCAFFLLPTAAALLAGSRPYKADLDWQMLVLPRARNLFYKYFSYGITGTMLLALFGNIFSKDVQRCDKFLNITLLVFTISPLVPFLLNGMLYLNGKSMIPFLPLYVYCFVMFLKNLKERKSKIVIPIILTMVFVLICCLFHNDQKGRYMIVALEIAIFIICHRKTELICLYTVVFLLPGVFSNDIKYASVDFVESTRIEEISAMMETSERGNYRTNVSYMDRYTCNRTFGENFMGVSSYSSTPNKLYLDFYENHIGNNESVRNSIMVTGSRNEQFYCFMGARYIFAETDPGFLYEKVQSNKNLNMYKNEHAYPIVYKSKNLISEKSFDAANFPYNIELLMHNTVVEGEHTSPNESYITKYDVAESYFVESNQEQEYSIELDEVFRNKLLYLSFNINNTGEYENTKVLEITINGVSNLLNNVNNTYYNENTKFEYVISMEDTNTLDIKVASGTYDIYGLEMYYSDMDYEEYQEANNLSFNEKDDTITCSVDAVQGEYLVTSIPYDKGFSATINGKKAEIEIVNKAFIGLKLENGKNDIVFKYNSPFLNIGYILSLLGLAAFVWIFVKERKRPDSSVSGTKE